MSFTTTDAPWRRQLQRVRPPDAPAGARHDHDPALADAEPSAPACTGPDGASESPAVPHALRRHHLPDRPLDRRSSTSPGRSRSGASTRSGSPSTPTSRPAAARPGRSPPTDRSTEKYKRALDPSSPSAPPPPPPPRSASAPASSSSPSATRSSPPRPSPPSTTSPAAALASASASAGTRTRWTTTASTTRTRRDKGREHLLAMRRLWEDDEAEFHGDHVDFDPSWSWPKPVQRPLPVLVGGAAGPKLFQPHRRVRRRLDPDRRPRPPREPAQAPRRRRRGRPRPRRPRGRPRWPSSPTPASSTTTSPSASPRSSSTCRRRRPTRSCRSSTATPPSSPRRARSGLTAVPEPVPVTDPADPRLADYFDLRAGRPDGIGPVIVEGLLAVEQLAASDLAHPLRAGHPAQAATACRRCRRRRPSTSPTRPCSAPRSASTSTAASSPAPSDHRPRTPAAVLDGARRVLVCERVNDLENLGSLFRNARAFGADAVLLDPETADPLARRPVRVSLGHALRVPSARLDDWPGGLRTVVAAGASPSWPSRRRAVPSRRPAAPGRLPRRRRGPGPERRCPRRRRPDGRHPMASGVDSSTWPPPPRSPSAPTSHSGAGDSGERASAAADEQLGAHGGVGSSRSSSHPSGSATGRHPSVCPRRIRRDSAGASVPGRPRRGCRRGRRGSTRARAGDAPQLPTG